MRHNYLGALACLTAIAASTESLPAAEITLGASKDATIYQNNVNNSNGAGQAIFAGTNTALSPRRGLIAFNVAGSFPAGATISSVQLTLFLNQVAGAGMGGGGGAATISLYRLTADWGEGTTGSATSGAGGTGQGFPAGDGDATWNARFYSTTTSLLWATPGGDSVATASASAVVGTTLNQGYSWGSTSQLVADVQAWLDTPSSNFGWLLKNEDEISAQKYRAFWTREEARTDPTSQFVPQLQITYTSPPATITQWRSVRSHNGVGELAIVLNSTASGGGSTGPAVEPRSAGVQIIQLDFSTPVTLTGNPVAGIAVSNASNSYSATSVSQLDSDTIAINFDPGVLPDQKCYTITIGPGTVTQTLAGDLNCNVRALMGDTTGDGSVNLSDALFTLAKSAASATAASAPQHDVDLSGGIIDLADALFSKSLITSPAHQLLCP